MRADATVAAHTLDPNPEWRHPPAGTALGEMVDVVGIAVAACQRRFGPVEDPWALAVQLTRGSILATRAQYAWHGRRI